MGAKVTLDLGEIAAGLQRAAPHLPEIFNQAAQAGILSGLPPVVGKLIPLAGPALKAFGAAFGGPSDGADGLMSPKLPDPGKRGYGRRQYLDRGKRFSDADVVSALNMILHPSLEAPAADEVRDGIMTILEARHDNETPTVSQERSAIDFYIRSGTAPEGLRDVLGDRLWGILKSGNVIHDMDGAIADAKSAAQPPQKPQQVDAPSTAPKVVIDG